MTELTRNSLYKKLRKLISDSHDCRLSAKVCRTRPHIVRGEGLRVHFPEPARAEGTHSRGGRKDTLTSQTEQVRSEWGLGGAVLQRA